MCILAMEVLLSRRDFLQSNRARTFLDCFIADATYMYAGLTYDFKAMVVYVLWYRSQ